MVYESALRRMGVKDIPRDTLAQARLFQKLQEKAGIVSKTKGSIFSPQRVTWGNRGEGY